MHIKKILVHCLIQSGKQAEMYLPAHHPIAKELQALDYTQMREKFQEEHRVKFRYATLHKNITAHLANRLPLKNVFRLAVDEISILHDLIPCNWPVALCLYLL